MKQKIIYYAPTANMGETSESNAEKYRGWALGELQKKYPDFEIEVSDSESTDSFWTNVDECQKIDRIRETIHNLWDYCPWDWVEQITAQEKTKGGSQ